ncbi:hypothetical protein L228DRAFT_179448 [Xylona heveae TC161]|uniref:Uncharacterized protein n=1 Tax=Xylona heveae (strain CBS 132557 / TC161) TaxID=1328760 RepID=A0A165FBE9_XYLHT|nr:hypothetical protein L228DRAFT_179448 [Xylona heveae TC161]KZF20785.1 hypothetical protein L228DRAFT_179448 [Xylona heveae TC161]
MLPIQGCRWSLCDLSPECPAERPVKLTTDTGGPSDTFRCDTYPLPMGGHGFFTRALCCPPDHGLENCKWHDGSVCSERCPSNQLELDSDPFGGSRSTACANARQAKFCCDPPTGITKPFSIVPLENIFPSAFWPPPPAIVQYDLISFGGGFKDHGDEDPNSSGVAFLLFAGAEEAVSRMKKRDGETDGIQFLSCPKDPHSRGDDELQHARVVCLNEEISTCFPVQKAGVEGTLVSMPRECGGGFARAVAMILSSNQSIPDDIATRNPTSPVFDFAFDYDMKHIRRDGGSISMRVDFSNVPGYWNAVVDNPGNGQKKRDIDRRFFSNSLQDWQNQIQSLQFNENSNTWNYMEDKLLFFQSNQACEVDSDLIPEGLAMGVHTEVSAKTYYGFSMIATIDSQQLNVHQANGFFNGVGVTDFIAELSGVGRFDADRIHSNPMISQADTMHQGGFSLFKGLMKFDPYLVVQYTAGTNGGDVGAEGVEWNGYSSGRVIQDLPNTIQHFPPSGDESLHGNDPAIFSTGQLFPNTLNPDGNTAGSISASAIAKLGLSVSLNLPSSIASNVGTMPDMSLTVESSLVFSADNTSFPDQTCMYVLGSATHSTNMQRGGTVNWGRDFFINMFHKYGVAGPRNCFPNQAESGNYKRENSERRSTPTGTYLPGENRLILYKNLFPNIVKSAAHAANGAANGVLATKNQLFNALAAAVPSKANVLAGLDAASVVFQATGAFTCEVTTNEEEKNGCCGCISMRAIYGAADDPDSDDNDNDPSAIDDFLDTGDDPDDSSKKRGFEEMGSSTGFNSTAIVGKRNIGGITTGKKTISVFGKKVRSPQYPSFPQYEMIDPPKVDWDRDSKSYLLAVLKYYHNASAECDNWDVFRSDVYDEEYYAEGQKCRTDYETEHVFEAQTIAQFFNDYTISGYLPWFSKRGNNVRSEPQWDSTWGTNYVTRFSTNWRAPNPAIPSRQIIYSFMDRLLMELGTGFARGRGNQDRLTILSARVNNLKGRLFKGNQGVSPNTFSKFSEQARKLAFKELGMAFTYMNLPEVSAKFCSSYQGMYDLMGQFDSWHAEVNPDAQDPALQAKWKNFIRELLDNIVLLGRENAKSLWQIVRNDNKDNLDGQWKNVAQREAKKLRLTFTCDNLPTETFPEVQSEFSLDLPDIGMGGT